MHEEKGTTEDETAGRHTNLMDMNLSKFQETVENGEAWRPAVHVLERVGHNLATRQQFF